MNGWDPAASPERTRRHWRKSIGEVLEEMVTEALQRAEEVLAAEGVLHSNAA
jgi:hypothetical protein